jgi:hypothetical protein
MKVYLSIDLDFWNSRDFPEEYFERLVESDLPIIVVGQHHRLVPHIRQFDFDALANLDYHSDLADRDSGSRGQFSRQVRLACGTWVNHVNGKNRRYIWSYPRQACIQGSGTCHCDHNPFNHPHPEKVCGWSQVEHRMLWYPRLKDVVAIGIAISRGWADQRLIRHFNKWRLKYPQLKKAA